MVTAQKLINISDPDNENSINIFMRPEILFQLTLQNRVTAIMREGVFVRKLTHPDYCSALYLMGGYYYELTLSTDETELLYVSFIDESDVEFIFPGKDEFENAANIFKKKK